MYHIILMTYVVVYVLTSLTVRNAQMPQQETIACTEQYNEWCTAVGGWAGPLHPVPLGGWAHRPIPVLLYEK